MTFRQEIAAGIVVNTGTGPRFPNGLRRRMPYLSDPDERGWAPARWAVFRARDERRDPMDARKKLDAAGDTVTERLDAAGYKAGEKLESLAENFGDTVESTNQRLTDKFGGATEKFADKVQQITHQGPYDDRTPGEDKEDGERGFMHKVNDVLDTLADKIPTGENPRRPGGQQPAP
jgi:hypothetical protein